MAPSVAQLELATPTNAAPKVVKPAVDPTQEKATVHPIFLSSRLSLKWPQRDLLTLFITPTLTWRRSSLPQKSMVCYKGLRVSILAHFPLDFVEPGTRADPVKPNLLNPNTKVKHVSPYLGTEISGVQISSLSKEGLDELALYAAERKVLLFRDQDFKDLSADRQIEIARYAIALSPIM